MGNVVFGSSGAFGANNVYVVVRPPQPVIPAQGDLFLAGFVGGASWGPIGVPLTASSAADQIANFGGPLNGNSAPMTQEVAVYLKQQPQGGAVGVRIGDGTQAAASITMLDSGASIIGFTATAKYTGSEGNQIKVTVDVGSGSTSGTPTVKCTVVKGRFTPEVYDNIPGAANALWVNICNAVNNGSNFTAGPSKFAVLTAGPSTLAPTLPTTVTLTGGVDGVTTLTKALLLGTDGSGGSRLGMYALRGTKLDTVVLCGLTDATSWSTMLAFAKEELCLAIGSMPDGASAGTTLASFATAAVSDPYLAVMVDNIIYFDTQLNLNQSLAPACILAGVTLRVNAHESPGNKTVAGILGTSKTLGANPQPYSDADEANLQLSGISWVSPSIPGARALGIRHGKNTSSTFGTSEIAYTRKTNQIVRDLKGPTMGQFVDLPQGSVSNPAGDVREQVRSALNDYFGPQKGKEIDNYGVICDSTNNTPTTVRLGELIADIEVEYLAIINKFIINITAGQTVQVSLQSTRAA